VTPWLIANFTGKQQACKRGNRGQSKAVAVSGDTLQEYFWYFEVICLVYIAKTEINVLFSNDN